MRYSDKLRALFPGTELTYEDLFLLETFQIRYLPDRVPLPEFVTLIRTFPVVQRFLVSKYPPLAEFLERILKEHEQATDQKRNQAMCQEALWEIADLIIYNKHPELFDREAPTWWDIDLITSVTSLEGKSVADVGAGSGRIAFLVAPYARTVYAVEPVTSLRSYMKEKALDQGISNLFVTDGTLEAIPLPDHSLDLLLTSNAMGWNLEGELNEIERVVRPGGHIIHLFTVDKDQENPFHDILTAPTWNYTLMKNEEQSKLKLRYKKQIPSH